jgi:hypothetical protein
MESNLDFEPEKRKIREIFLKDSSLIITSAYIILIGIGMVFSYQSYLFWGIDILQYAELSDFLLAPFADVLVFLFLASSFGLVWIAIIFNNWLESKFPKIFKLVNLGFSPSSKYYKSKMTIGYVVSTFVYIALASMLFGLLKYRSIRNNKMKNRVEVCFQNGMPDRCKIMLMIGKTSSFVFLSDTLFTKIEAIPIEGNIASISKLKFDSTVVAKRKKLFPFLK